MVPSPTNRRMNCDTGSEAVNAPVAEAPGVITPVLAAGPINGSPVVMALAAARAVPEPEPSSRRDTANAAHANGPATGTPPSLPAPNHDN